MLGLHLRFPPLLETWQRVPDLVAGGHVLDLVAGGQVLDLVAVLVVGELDRPDDRRPVVACRGDHRGGGAVGQAQDHAVVTLYQHSDNCCQMIRVTRHYL